VSFRKTIFWLHLVAGIVAGLVIGVMSFTGAALAFEKEIIAWAERDARRIEMPATAAPRLSVDELLQRLRQTHADARPSAIVVSADPTVAVAFGAGREATYYANPYTGEIRPGSAMATRAFMRTMNTWHRVLGVEGEHRNIARAATGAGNIAFLVLAVSGLYLWWPRTWTRQALRAVTAFNFNLGGKARDFNWHNVIGFWSAPVLIVLTATALPLSYRWAGDAIYKLTGSEAPAPGTGPGFGGPQIAVEKPAANATPLTRDALLVAAQNAAPAWNTVTLRLGGGRGEAGPARNQGASTETRAPRENRDGTSRVVVSIKESGTWPRTATTTLTLNPFTGEVLRREGFADQNLGRRVRMWTRFLHTGEALGWAGQLVAGLACAGGLVLVWTGLALAWRRFFPRRKAALAAAANAEPIVRPAVSVERD
jgi:uncharacterized iron-regulated membrane protein